MIIPRFEVRVAERSSVDRRDVPPSALAGADVEEEAGQERGPIARKIDQQRVVDPGLEDPEHEEEHPDPG